MAPSEWSTRYFSLLTETKAHVAETGEVVAIKKVYQDKRYKNRELQIMKDLTHPNIVKMKHAFYTRGEKVRSVRLSRSRLRRYT